jgi:hypothetical protein
MSEQMSGGYNADKKREHKKIHKKIKAEQSKKN